LLRDKIHNGQSLCVFRAPASMADSWIGCGADNFVLWLHRCLYKMASEVIAKL
jgi:hypothetical protein